MWKSIKTKQRQQQTNKQGNINSKIPDVYYEEGIYIVNVTIDGILLEIMI